MLVLAFGITGCATTSQELPTQPDVELSEYSGTWFEQARLPNRFQKDCVANVQAEYVLQADGTLSVSNQCTDKDGATKTAQAQGRLSNAVATKDSAILEVRFAPKWMSWLPLVWGDYWIMKIHGDYQYSLVGTPDRKYLWVLARDQQADENVVNELLDYAKTQGFETDTVIKTSP